VNLSQVECIFPLIAPAYIEQALTGRVTRWGDDDGCPLKAGLRCAGEDDWVLAMAADVAAVRRLGELAGAGDGDVSAALAVWAAQRAADDVMAGLQAVGVAAGVMRNPGELQVDPHLLARGAWEWVDRPWIGVHSQELAAFREHGEPYPVIHPSPLLGEFNEEVLGGILGLTAKDLEGLAARGVIGREPVASTRTSVRRPA
jgi:crotonobetainyl-CoA:carnitine CoA-transferase CaiB-like acyl-CoA transferase